MKKFLIASAAIAAAMIAAPAFAGEVDINLGAVAIEQQSVAPVAQQARSAVLAIGDAVESTLDSTALSGLNMASIEESVAQGANLVDGNGLVTNVGQVTGSTVNQVAQSLVGSGGLDTSTSTGLAATIANQASVKVTVTQ